MERKKGSKAESESIIIKGIQGAKGKQQRRRREREIKK